MNSIYMVQNDKGEWLFRDGDCWSWGEARYADCFPLKLATYWARNKGGTVVEFIPRAEVHELVEALRKLHDFAEPSGHFGSAAAFAEAAALLKKWEPSA